MASNVTHSFKDDITTMITSGKDFSFPKGKTILVVQNVSTGEYEIYHNNPEDHAEEQFLGKLRSETPLPTDNSADESLPVDELLASMQISPTLMTEYKLYINYSPCQRCAPQIKAFLDEHSSVKFHIHYAKTYYDNVSPLKELNKHGRISLSTMNGDTWKFVITKLLEIYIYQLRNLEEQIQNESGYDTLKKTMQYLNFEGDFEKRKKADTHEEERLEQIKNDSNIN